MVLMQAYRLKCFHDPKGWSDQILQRIINFYVLNSIILLEIFKVKWIVDLCTFDSWHFAVVKIGYIILNCNSVLGLLCNLCKCLWTINDHKPFHLSNVYLCSWYLLKANMKPIILCLTSNTQDTPRFWTFTN